VECVELKAQGSSYWGCVVSFAPKSVCVRTMHTIQIHGTSAEQKIFQLIGYSERVPILEVNHCLISGLYWDSVMGAPTPLMIRRRTLRSLHSVEPPFGTLPPATEPGRQTMIRLQAPMKHGCYGVVDVRILETTGIEPLRRP
jgi:hypothetical protein